MKNFLAKFILCCALFFQLASCHKAIELITGDNQSTTSFKHYLISQGQHSSQQSAYTLTEYTELRFIVKFDSSAIYTTEAAENQLDVNKLYGFSDNELQHHEFSARIGWRWSDGALRLFGYTYNNGAMSYEEITTIPIGTENECAIKVSADKYIFSVNGITTTMLRTSSDSMAKGYKLYPYFGGDETAPHDIHIWIKEK